MFQLSKAVRQLFYANIAIFFVGLFLQAVGFPFIELFACFPKAGFFPTQLITYQFLHGGFMHIIFNMLALISIAPQVEDYLGYKKFWIYYLLCGIGSAFMFMLFSSSSVCLVGASGSIYGIVLMFAFLHPDQKLYFFGILGLKAKYLVSLLFAYEIYASIFPSNDGIGHLGHVGGGITGIILFYLDKVYTHYQDQSPDNYRPRKWS
jgi:membrane associated rhomboid family serine protease